MVFQHRVPPGGPQEHPLGGYYDFSNEGSNLFLSPVEVGHWGAQTWHRFWMFRLYLKTSFHHPMRNCPIVTFFCKTWKFSECKSYRGQGFFPHMYCDSEISLLCNADFEYQKSFLKYKQLCSINRSFGTEVLCRVVCSLLFYFLLRLGWKKESWNINPSAL